jgi:hypothetical protein
MFLATAIIIVINYLSVLYLCITITIKTLKEITRPP